MGFNFKNFLKDFTHQLMQILFTQQVILLFVERTQLPQNAIKETDVEVRFNLNINIYEMSSSMKVYSAAVEQL